MSRNAKPTSAAELSTKIGGAVISDSSLSGCEDRPASRGDSVIEFDTRKASNATTTFNTAANKSVVRLPKCSKQ